jgi:hypothetical protein
MNCAMNPLTCDPARLTGLPETLILSRYENNYGGAVKRLNAIGERLAEVDWASAPVFVINGLRREALVWVLLTWSTESGGRSINGRQITPAPRRRTRLRCRWAERGLGCIELVPRATVVATPPPAWHSGAAGPPFSREISPFRARPQPLHHVASTIRVRHLPSLPQRGRHLPPGPARAQPARPRRLGPEQARA